MKLFEALFEALDSTKKINTKVAALVNFFEHSTHEDSMWAIAILSGKRPKRAVKTNLLKQWVAEETAIPYWLFDETYHVVGDLAETIAKLLPPPTSLSEHSFSYWVHYLIDLKDKEDDDKRAQIIAAWQQLTTNGRYIFNKLITGGFRLGVSQKLMIRALSNYTNIEENVLACKLMGNWSPETISFQELILSEDRSQDLSKPYPFYLAYALDISFDDMGAVSDWQIERKWDGIRGQIIVREDTLFIWSRGEELVTDKFPELHFLAEALPNGTVLDGEILCWQGGKPMPFQSLQTRIGRKNVSKSLLQKSPVSFMVYDILELQGNDMRALPMQERRQSLASLYHSCDESSHFLLSELVQADSWQALAVIRENARQYLCEGLMLKHKTSPYEVGRKKGSWWKWKVDPLVIDAVMIYAMRGHGRRANLYTDYTFAVWKDEQLIPFTKAYSGLTDKEIAHVDAFVKKNTLERFGPVRSVKAELVFEIAFEGIQKSSRHKSGIALRFPRISRWRQDKPASEANTLDDLEAMLHEIKD